MKIFKKNLSLLLNFLTISALFGASQAHAIGLGAGLAAIDSMDDRAEPAATVRLGWTERVYSQIYYWGKDFGPVTERNLFFTVAGETPIKGSQYLFVNYGAVASEYRVSLYDNASSRRLPDPPPVEREREYNLGAVLGLSAQARAGAFRASFHWDSHIFFTGSPFIIFLTSARKQSISLMLGVDI